MKTIKQLITEAIDTRGNDVLWNNHLNADRARRVLLDRDGNPITTKQTFHTGKEGDEPEEYDEPVKMHPEDFKAKQQLYHHKALDAIDQAYHHKHGTLSYYAAENSRSHPEGALKADMMVHTGPEDLHPDAGFVNYPLGDQDAHMRSHMHMPIGHVITLTHRFIARLSPDAWKTRVNRIPSTPSTPSVRTETKYRQDNAYMHSSRIHGNGREKHNHVDHFQVGHHIVLPTGFIHGRYLSPTQHVEHSYVLHASQEHPLHLIKVGMASGANESPSGQRMHDVYWMLHHNSMHPGTRYTHY